MKKMEVQWVVIVNSIKDKELKEKLVELLTRYEKLSCPVEWEDKISSLLAASDYCNVFDLSPSPVISKARDLISRLIEDQEGELSEIKNRVASTFEKIEGGVK